MRGRQAQGGQAAEGFGQPLALTFIPRARSIEGSRVLSAARKATSPLRFQPSVGGRTRWWNMPQIWMTYDELATLCGCSATEARLLARYLSLHRRKSSDGFTRIKLDLALTARFF